MHLSIQSVTEIGFLDMLSVRLGVYVVVQQNRASGKVDITKLHEIMLWFHGTLLDIRIYAPAPVSLLGVIPRQNGSHVAGYSIIQNDIHRSLVN